jgi:hypothetical protein
MKKLAALLLAFGFMASNADATLISINEQQDITSGGQGFLFEFDDLIASNGGVGTLTFGASGDYNSSTSNEDVVISLGLFGSFVMDDSGVISNNITGLTFDNFTSTEVLAVYDSTFEVVFNVSASLLNLLLSSGTLDVTIQNDSGVGNFYHQNRSGTDEDYVSFDLTYNAVTSPINVSESSNLLMMLLSVGILFFTRRGISFTQ